MKKILLPIDFSKSTEQVISYIKANLINKIEEIYLLNVISEPGYISFEDIPVIMPEGWLEDAKNSVSKKLSLLAKSLPSSINVHCDVKTTTGSIDDVILNYANDKSVDLIILGTNSKNLVERFIIGSVTDKLLRSTKIPMLVIPPS